MKIACLPLAGPHNPYQRLMRAGLERAGHPTVGGRAGRVFALARTAFGLRPDALHLDWPGSYYGRRNTALALVQAGLFWADLALLRLLGVPLVWTAHNLVEHEVLHPCLDAWAKRHLARRARRVRVFTESQRAEAAERLGVPIEKTVAVPEGSYIGHYLQTQLPAEARASLGLATAARVILHFGNLRPYKGSMELVEAFQQVAGPDDALVLAGPAHSPAYVQALKTAAGGDGRIHLYPGFVDEERVQTFFAAADLAAFPFQRIDNSGSVILAMGFGLPCLAPAVGAVAGRLHAQPQLLFAPGHLRDTLAQALELPKEELLKIGQRNRQEALRYRWEDFAAVFSTL